MPDKSPEDVFLELMQGVKPIKPKKSIFGCNKPHSKSNQKIVLTEDKLLDDEASSIGKINLTPKFEGAISKAKPKPKKRLKVNKYFEPEWIVDLHGQTRDEAMDTTEACIYRAIQNGTKNLLIITGKGLNSGKAGAVLKDTIWDFLQQSEENRIERIQWAPKHLGGEGAILVLFY